MKSDQYITAQEFRSEMINLVRAFDNWAYKDQLASPEDYDQYNFDDWFDLFKTFMENHNEVG